MRFTNTSCDVGCTICFQTCLHTRTSKRTCKFAHVVLHFNFNFEHEHFCHYKNAIVDEAAHVYGASMVGAQRSESNAAKASTLRSGVSANSPACATSLV